MLLDGVFDEEKYERGVIKLLRAPAEEEQLEVFTPHSHPQKTPPSNKNANKVENHLQRKNHKQKTIQEMASKSSTTCRLTSESQRGFKKNKVSALTYIDDWGRVAWDRRRLGRGKNQNQVFFKFDTSQPFCNNIGYPLPSCQQQRRCSPT